MVEPYRSIHLDEVKLEATWCRLVDCVPACRPARALWTHLRMLYESLCLEAGMTPLHDTYTCDVMA